MTGRAPACRPRSGADLGRAAVVREGSDVTIATLSTMVERSLRVADRLAAERIEVEVVDLRSVCPLDHDTVARSVAKTSRLLVVDEDYQSFGMSGEVITTAVEGAFDHLDAPPARVAYPDVPIPYSRPLEQFCLPNAEKIAQAARRLLGK